MEQPTSFLQPLVPPSQSPVFVTTGRPIVILPKEYTLPKSGHSFLTSGVSSSSAFYFQPHSITNFCDSPAPIIRPIDDGDDDDSLGNSIPEMTQAVAVRPITRAIEFSDVQQIVSGCSQEVKMRKNKEEWSSGEHDLSESGNEPTAELASEAVASFNIGKSLVESTVASSSPIADLTTVTTLPDLPLVSEQSVDKDIKMSLLNVSSFNSQLGIVDPVEIPLCKSSKGMSPLISVRYEESKEPLVLDDSDSELEMPDCSNNSVPVSHQSDREKVVVHKDEVNSQSKSGPVMGETSSAEHESESSRNIFENKMENHECDSIASIPVQPKLQVIVDDEAKSISLCECPAKRAKMSHPSTEDLEDDSVCDVSTYSLPKSHNHDLDGSVVSNKINESNKNSVQTVPDVPFTLTKSPEAATPLPSPHIDVDLDCPHEPMDVASDGKDTVDQMLPTECAREHAMVPNMARCTNEDNQRNNDRDEPNDDNDKKIGCTHLLPWVPASHFSQEEISQNQQTSEHTVLQLEKIVEPNIAETHNPSSLADTPSDISAKPYTSLVDPTFVESAQHDTEHQIVPEECFNNTSPSSQSLYTDFHGKSEKCYPSIQDESSVEQLDEPMVSGFMLNAIEMRKNEKSYPSRRGDQALPGSHSQQNNGIESSYELSVGETTRVVRTFSGQGLEQGLFDFQWRKHTPQSQGKLK